MNKGIFFLGLALFTVSHALTINTAGGSLESAYAEWAPESGASAYNVYCDGSLIDSPLVRSYGSYLRADIPGLKAGSHTLKVAPVINGKEGSAAEKSVTVLAHDRSGFAFSNNRVPGAYKADGTPKDNAVILYITEKTKNSISFAVTTNAKGSTTTYTGLQNILDGVKKGYETRPIIIRLVGEITDFSYMLDGDIVIENAKNASSYITLEGIGKDATANGWGIRVKNASNVEIRNIGIMNVNSGEGDNIGLQQNNDYIWVHNNDFFYGDAGSDADQVKGDGALDCKKSTYVTFSYNHFFDNGKCNLLGLSEGTTTGLYITYHHNWYDHSDSRHPRVRYYSAHVYNNYYDGNSKYGIGSTLASSVFAEANYFRNCKYPMLTSMQGSDLYAGTTSRSSANATFSKENGGTIKAYGNSINGTCTFIPYGASTYTLKGKETSVGSINTKTDFDAYVVSSKSTTVPSSVVSAAGSNTYNNFDTDASIMYSYKADDAATAKENVIKYAGRVQGGDFTWSFDNSDDDESHDVNQALKDALVAYKTTLVTIQGEGDITVVESSSSITVSSSSVKSSSSVSSSSSLVSSSSVKSSSSSVVSSSSVIPEISDASTILLGDEVHNFTENGLNSSFYTISGKLSQAKGTITLGTLTLTQCLKMESSTEITFTSEQSGTLYLVFNADFNGKVSVDNKSYYATSGVATVYLEAGSHTILKETTTNLFYMSLIYSAGAVEESNVATLIKHGAGSSNQEVSLGDSIQYFFYEWSAATTVNVSGLPDGITVVVNNYDKIVEIFGTPTESGTFEYTITTEGAFENVSIQRKIIVNALYAEEGAGSENGNTEDNTEISFKNSVIQMFTLNGRILEFNGNAKLKVDVFDMQGHALLRAVNVNRSVSLERIPAGNYVVRIGTGTKFFTKRITLR